MGGDKGEILVRIPVTAPLMLMEGGKGWDPSHVPCSAPQGEKWGTHQWTDPEWS